MGDSSSNTHGSPTSAADSQGNMVILNKAESQHGTAILGASIHCDDYKNTYQLTAEHALDLVKAVELAKTVTPSGAAGLIPEVKSPLQPVCAELNAAASRSK